MRLRERIQRWWSPAKWQDEHPQAFDGEGYALTEDQRSETQTSRDRRAGTPYGRYRAEEPTLPHGFEHS